MEELCVDGVWLVVGFGLAFVLFDDCCVVT